MKRSVIMFAVIFMTLALVIMPLIAACSKPAPAPTPAPAPAPTPAPAPPPKPEPIVLKTVQAGWLGHPLFVGFDWFVEQVNGKSNGALTIDIIGGPDVIPIGDQGDAVAAGTIDMNANYGGFLIKLVTAMNMYYQRRISPQEMQSSGAYDLLQDEFNKVGIYFLGPGREIQEAATNMVTNVWVDNSEDLAGQRITSSATFSQWITALDMTYISASPSERYSAMERGVVDGACNSIEGTLGASYFEVADYWIDHGVYSSGEVILMNLDKWNSLPEHLQKLLTDVQHELIFEQMPAMAEQVQIESKQGLRDNGMRPIVFKPEDAKRFVETSYEAKWAANIEKFPEWGPRMYEMWGKP
ncbi:TRAP transporter substrate-binding protein DctP [Chloroflexota bacterium]